MNLTLGPDNSLEYNSHCLRRDLVPAFAQVRLNSTVISFTQDAPSFFEFDRRVQSLAPSVNGVFTHGGGHFGVGGMVGAVCFSKSEVLHRSCLPCPRCLTCGLLLETLSSGYTMGC